MESALIEIDKTVAAIVLAAGRSSRMGRAKQLEIVNRTPMVVQAIRLALQSGAGQVLVVTGAYAELVQVLLQQYPELYAEGRLALVHNPEWASGQASSVHTALAALPDEIQAALFLPVDQPFLQPCFLQELICTWQHKAKMAAPTVDGEPRGAPAIFDRSFWPELFAISGDVGGRPVLLKHKADVVWLTAPPGSLRDIDTPQDLVRVRQG
jgi:molybdenum cofactor cytidylyltransferase